MVHLARLKLNSDLEGYLKEHPIATLRQQPATQTRLSYRRPPWRVRDRLSDRDVLRLIVAFRTGIAKWELARRYGIGVKSVQQLLRQHSVARKR